MTAAAFDSRMDRIAAGERLSPDEIRELCAGPDLLEVGMLADALRRRMHGTRVTYVRVATFTVDRAPDVPSAAREVRITGEPKSLEQAVTVIAAARTAAGTGRTVSGLSWPDVERLAALEAQDVDGVLARLRGAGLDAVADLQLDRISDAENAIARLRQAGFDGLCLSVQSADVNRTSLWTLASSLQEQFGCIRAINPLATRLNAFRPTTGYEDVKMVAAARLAAPNIFSIQIDWQQYGPKLAQVALTFGADDLWGISASDEAPEGRRRAAVEEVRRNVEAAGFAPVERDGRFVTA
jgi:CofH/MqnC-like protein